MDPYGPPRKRPRPDSGPLNGNGTIGGHGGVDDYNKDGSSGNRTKPCTKFFSTSGCPYGEGCHFLHFVPGGLPNMGGHAPLANIGSMGGGGARKVVGGLGGGGAGADDQGANLGGFKTRLCNRFDTPEGCRFSDKCHFAHGEKELRKSTNTTFSTPVQERQQQDAYPRQDQYSRDPPAAAPYRPGGYNNNNNGGRFGARDGAQRFGGYREPTPPGMAAANSFGASSTAKISIEASLAGAIIGKGGINAKQICRITGAKLSIKEHETDPGLRNVEMEGSFEQIKQASQMVRHVLMNRDNVPARPSAGAVSHNFKTKLCENFQKGTCTFGDRCHFAHGAEDLRDPYRT